MVLGIGVVEGVNVVVILVAVVEVRIVAGIGVVEDESMLSFGNSLDSVSFLFVKFWLISVVYFVYILCCLKNRLEHVIKINRDPEATERDARVFNISQIVN